MGRAPLAGRCGYATRAHGPTFRGHHPDDRTNPLVRLNRVTGGRNVEIYAKLEFFNLLEREGPDRRQHDRRRRARGVLGKDSVIIEPTSGNTGIALAFVAAARGYRRS